MCIYRINKSNNFHCSIFHYIYVYIYENANLYYIFLYIACVYLLLYVYKFLCNLSIQFRKKNLLMQINVFFWFDIFALFLFFI